MVIDRILFTLELAYKQYKLTPERFKAYCYKGSSNTIYSKTIIYSGPKGEIHFIWHKDANYLEVRPKNLGIDGMISNAWMFGLVALAFSKAHRIHYKLFWDIYLNQPKDLTKDVQFSVLKNIADQFPDVIDDHLLGDNKK